MVKKYDLVIVGAGPSGAMAANTAAENGLRVALLERKTNPAQITRGCAQMFLYEDGAFEEKMYYNKKNKKIIFPVNGFTVDYDGPTHNFYAWHFYAPDAKTRLEFGDYEENYKKGDEGRLSFVYDKAIVIDGLIQKAITNGVELFTGINVNGIEKTATGVRVTGGGDTFEGTFVIGADGQDSRVANLLGFNKERTLYVALPGISYYCTGVSIDQSEAMLTPICFKPNAQLPTGFWSIPSPYAEDEYWVAVRSKEDFDFVTTKSVFAQWFADVKVNKVRSYIYSLWSPVSEPFKDNVLLVGDAPWFAEAEITGSMMCGWKAAHAVTAALRDNKQDREGVLNYIEWWKKSFPEHDDYRNMLLFFPFTLIFSEEELLYLYNLIEKPLRATINPFLTVKLFKQALEPLMSRIEREMPTAEKKLKMLETDNVENILLELKSKMKK